MIAEEIDTSNIYVEPLIKMEFITVPAGCFVMSKNLIKNNKKLERKVCVEEFKMAKTEVTQQQYLKVVGDNPSNHIGDDLPVEMVNWLDIQKFIQKLNETTGKKFRLPSEAEWEYACLGGLAEAKYCGSGEVLDTLGWYWDNSGRVTHPVAQKLPNGFGLYDMSGNVSEWVQDCFNKFFEEVPTDGSAWENEGCKFRVVRGGSYYEELPRQLMYKRNGWNKTRSYRHMGFRLAME